mmetsp:Transcript_93654/g.270575  ORF Transcript_93654/g.270575 Transcript_93654/m.270575 type:complete len:243 (-) Transcript_93654:884-1612(-)
MRIAGDPRRGQPRRDVLRGPPGEALPTDRRDRVREVLLAIGLLEEHARQCRVHASGASPCQVDLLLVSSPVLGHDHPDDLLEQEPWALSLDHFLVAPDHVRQGPDLLGGVGRRLGPQEGTLVPHQFLRPLLPQLLLLFADAEPAVSLVHVWGLGLPAVGSPHLHEALTEVLQEPHLRGPHDIIKLALRKARMEDNDLVHLVLVDGDRDPDVADAHVGVRVQGVARRSAQAVESVNQLAARRG